MATLASESFTGTNGAAWPGQWTTSANSGTVDIQSNQGRMVTTSVGFTNGPAALLSGMAAVADVDVTVFFTVPADTDIYHFLSVRADAYAGTNVDPTNGYTLINYSGNNLWIRRTIGGSSNDVTAQTTYISTVAGDVVGMRFQIAGTTLKAKTWNQTAGAEPGAWNITTTDVGGATSGKVGLSVFNGGAVVHTILWDDLLVQDPPPVPYPPITLRAAGTSTAVAALVTAINPAVPAGTTSTDLSVLCVECKPYTTTITTPTGWTKIGEATNGTTASAADVGATKIAMFVRIGATVGAIGNMTLTGADSAAAVIHSYAKGSAAYSWDYSAFTTGSQASTNNVANYSATGGVLPVSVEDWVIAATGANTDLVVGFTAQAINGLTGATLTKSIRTTGAADGQGLVTTGNDSKLIVTDAYVSAGTSITAPTFTYTSTSSSSGTTIWLRLRQYLSYTSQGGAPRQVALRRAANW